MDAFWDEMLACEHFVQIYDADEVFMDTLAGFIAVGFRQGMRELSLRSPLTGTNLMGLDVASARSQDQFISLDAEETISKFIIDGQLFPKVVADVLDRAGRNGRKVRVFGEMVALMWARGYCSATVRLERLWTEFCQKESFALFCAYPRTGFTEDPAQSIAHICATNSKVLAANNRA
jgi:MEDS: MEthanogen/methylotroph, DcmR Sensory domain